MADIARFPCLECGSPFVVRIDRERHWRDEAHGPRQVAMDAIDAARYSVMGDSAPEPESAYVDQTAPRFRVSQRRRMRVINGGRTS